MIKQTIRQMWNDRWNQYTFQTTTISKIQVGIFCFLERFNFISLFVLLFVRSLMCWVCSGILQSRVYIINRGNEYETQQVEHNYVTLELDCKSLTHIQTIQLTFTKIEGWWAIYVSYVICILKQALLVEKKVSFSWHKETF